MSDVQERSAEVIARCVGDDELNALDWDVAHDAVAALAAAGLLADDDTARLREILASLWLYVDWRYCTKQLTTAQKELWADCVDAETDNDHPVAVRWWRAAGVTPEDGR